MSALLLALFLQATPAPAATPAVEATPTPAAETASPAPEHPAGEAEGHAAGAATPASPEGHAPEAGEHAAAAAGEGHGESPADIIFHHVMDGPTLFGVVKSKHLLFLFVVALLVIALAQLAVRSYKGGQVPKGLGAAVESLVLFIRDEVAEPNIGHGDGRKFTPLLCSFFSFILLAALIGLLPLSATTTGNISVTLALATISFAAQQWAGISKYGLFGHFHNLVPPGMPWPMLIIMIPVEILGIFTKPFALTVRLFANMLAGHMVIVTLLLLIPLMGQLHWLAGAAMTPISLLLAVFIMLLELLVAFIQAYIFTLLTAIFIGMYAHPAH
jgi:F-type H+-transporting ATPase subunit a